MGRNVQPITGEHSIEISPQSCKLASLQKDASNRKSRKNPLSNIVFAVLLISASTYGRSQVSACYAGFEVSEACISERGLEQKVAAYQQKIAQAMSTLGASYKFDVRVVNDPLAAGYDANVGDVFTDVLRDQDMRNQSFIVNVTSEFLEKQPEILFEASSLHEVCHVINDDLTGYHRNGGNIEVAEERCVLQAVGESRYEQYLRAYSVYRHWDSSTYESFLRRVKNVALTAAPRESDEADRLAAEYFRSHADAHEHLLVYNGELHDVTLSSTRDRVRHDPDKLRAVINAGKPMIFFHNHPAEDGRAAMFPSYEDFGVAGLFSFMAYSQKPDLKVEFRVVQPGQQTTIVAYGFKPTAVEDLKRIAQEYRSAVSLGQDVATIEVKQGVLDYHLAQDSFNEYLQHACPVDLGRKDADVCRTHPEFFLWPSDRFFLHYRPQ